jgi:hypothetical protein
MLPHFRD